MLKGGANTNIIFDHILTDKRQVLLTEATTGTRSCGGRSKSAVWRTSFARRGQAVRRDEAWPWWLTV